MDFWHFWCGPTKDTYLVDPVILVRTKFFNISISQRSRNYETENPEVDKMKGSSYRIWILLNVFLEDLRPYYFEPLVSDYYWYFVSISCYLLANPKNINQRYSKMNTNEV